jgi:hypothetical protein
MLKFSKLESVKLYIFNEQLLLEKYFKFYGPQNNNFKNI